MTEDEAKQKWCPFARSGDTPETSGTNRFFQDAEAGIPTDCLCIASACMAWRWLSHPEAPKQLRAGACGLVIR